jgi:tetratricopeptide (TPR) repeat protein
MKRRFFLGLSLLGLAAASTTALGQSFEAAPQPPPGKALVYLYRLDTWPVLRTDALFGVGDMDVAALSANRYTWFHVPEGSYRLAQRWDTPRVPKVNQLEFMARAGSTYYFRLEVSAGMYQTQWRFAGVDASLASGEISKCRFQAPKAPEAWKPDVARSETDTALARGVAYRKNRQFSESVRELDESIRLDPTNAYAYFHRGDSYRELKQYEAAIRDLEQAIRLNENFALAYNNLAWMLATAEEPRVRNGLRAVELALKACELTSWRQAAALDTLAAAYARNGDFLRAMTWQEHALSDPQFPNRAEAEERLRLYRTGRAWPPD